MATFLYGRVSSGGQDTALQKEALLKRYPDGKYLEEKVSGKSLEKREKLQTILDIVGDGDKLVVWKLDRLARNMLDLLKIVELLQSKGTNLEILDQAIDTGTASGKAFLQMLGVFAEFETNLRAERQAAGIAAARADGKHLGRPQKLTGVQKEEVRRRLAAGEKPGKIAATLNVARATIYNAAKECPTAPASA